MSRLHEAKHAGQQHIANFGDEAGAREKGTSARIDYIDGTAEEKSMVRKIDLHVLPMLWLMYIFNYIDRTSKRPFPYIRGMTDAHLTDIGVRIVKNRWNCG